jgi:hypothetical protein
MSFKVLVGAPVYEGTRYSIKKFLERIRELDYDNYDVLLMDNSRGDEFFEELQGEKGVIIIKDGIDEGKNLLRVVSSRNKILDYGIEKGYDYVLMMDSDVLPPVGIIGELLGHGKDIVSGLYYNYFRVSGKIKSMPVAWKFFTEEQFEELKRLDIKLKFDAKSHEDIRRFMTEEEAESRDLLEVSICSPGCMLLSRVVCEKVRYGLLRGKEILGESTTDDIYFFREARRNGFKAFCDTSLRCEHMIEGKFDSSGIHPLHK